MLRKNKNILIGLSIVIILIVSMFFVFNKKEEYKELPRVKLKDSINTSGLAIMVESDYKTEQYTKWENKEFPTNGYTLNRIKSGCVDKNGNNTDALTYNEDNKTISIKTKQSVYCYLYYDNLFKGKGTEQEPYEINYIEDLVRLSNSVNKDSNNYNSKYFILKRDLDFNSNDSYMKYNDTGFGDINGVSGVEGIKDELTNQEGTGFIPIGNYSKPFEGNIDGKNNKISNLWIDYKTDVAAPIGFIGVLSNGIISNLTISGEVKTIVTTPLGGLVNRIQNSIIDNCINEVNVTSNNGSYGVGGLVGFSNGNTTIKNSTNKGNITNGNQTGGIIAVNNGGTLTIENCKNYGKIENNLGASISGIVGDLLASTEDNNILTIIKNTYNVGIIIGGTRSGGIIGRINPYNTVIIDKCYNLANLSSKRSDENFDIVGGLIGSDWKSTNAIILNSYNKGNIESLPENNKSFASGLVADAGDGLAQAEGYLKIINSYNVGNITGTMQLSTFGISKSQALYDNLILNNVYNSGDVTSTDKLTPNYAIGRLENNGFTINNTYYKKPLTGSNITNEGGTAMEESAMKNQTFADLLNSNLASIDLKTIDPLLDGYTLVNWVIDPNTGYPTLDYNLE